MTRKTQGMLRCFSLFLFEKFRVIIENWSILQQLQRILQSNFIYDLCPFYITKWNCYITLLLYALLRQQHYILWYKTFTKFKNELLAGGKLSLYSHCQGLNNRKHSVHKCCNSYCSDNICTRNVLYSLLHCDNTHWQTGLYDYRQILEEENSTDYFQNTVVLLIISRLSSLLLTMNRSVIIKH